MPDDVTRPDPDALLASLVREEEQAKRGRLTVFFGMCPGVGKTFAMLKAGAQKKREGVDVVVGIVETHGRAETASLLEGLPVMSRRTAEHRGASLEEMDLDALLERRPALALVDEAAHTNAPGSRHPKRYQDILELLEAGIDVFTTLNVQHVESRNDTVRQITGVHVRETVPDSLLDLADEIELVDITPTQLRQRLADGKVYQGERAEAAATNFFSEANLTALREMALRLTAEHVDRDLLEFMRTRRVHGGWQVGERLMAAVGPSPFSERLIRRTRLMAASLQAPWMVVSVESGRPLTPEAEARVTRYLSLARSLGAEVLVTRGEDVAEALLDMARRHHVTQIVVGQPLRARWLDLVRGGSLVSRLQQLGGDIDLHLIRAEGVRGAGPAFSARERAPLREYAHAFGIAVVVTALGFLLETIVGYRSVAFLFLLGVMAGAMFLGRGPVILLGAVSAVLWDYLFIPPRFTFYIHEVQDRLMVATFLVVALAAGQLTARLREREQGERERERRATALYRLTRAVAASGGLHDALRTVVRQTDELFRASTAVILVRPPDGLDVHEASSYQPGPNERGVAAWAAAKAQPAGRFTDTLPTAEALHLPLQSSGRVWGVLAVKPVDAHPWPLALRELLETFAAHITVVLEKDALQMATRQVELATESERLQKALFDSVSHELKTPLAAIVSASEQLDATAGTSAHPMTAEIREGAGRLNRVITNLVDLSRLDSGLLQAALEWCDAEELTKSTLDALGSPASARQWRVDVAPDLPPVHADPGLFEQALSNLLLNAAQHGAPGTPIEVNVRDGGGGVEWVVRDHGPGLAAGEEERVFGRFYRGAGATAGGMGLGLSIAQRFVQAMGGSLAADNAPGGGARFIITLPRGADICLPDERSR